MALGSLIVLMASIALPVHADALLDQAKRLMTGGDASKAFALLGPHEQQRAGEIDYDYLLGIAALDAGDPQRAVFALERVLAMNPNFTGARAEIARAYFVLGEKQNAQREFRTVRESPDLPGTARGSIDRYLSALEPVRTRIGGYFEVSYGLDTNVNSATSFGLVNAPGIVIPGLPADKLPADTARRDTYLGFAGSLTGSHNVTDAVALVASFTGNAKNNIHQDAFATQVYDVALGTRISGGAHSVSVALQGQAFWLDDSRYRDSSGMIAQWQWNLNERSQFSVFGQGARLNFPTQRTRDAKRVIGGFAYAHALGGAWNPIVFLSAYGGFEDPRNPDYPQFGNKPVGLRLGGQVTLGSATQLFALASYERRRYDAEDPLFLATRLDRQADYRLGLNYAFASRWTVTPSVSVTDNRSTLDLYTYSRLLGSVALRRDF